MKTHHTPKFQVYYDKEADYLEVRFGEPTESHYEKIGPDTFVRIDTKTQEKKGYAVFNVQKSTGSIKTLEFEIPLAFLKKFKDHTTGNAVAV